ncbi:hypothetical protein GCM10023176_08240 [Micromonospora coerulea]|uniref:Uncharacterized protein n=1 Tax=Micromonospora coerulea TaxID=47856 RepID=A0ABP8S7C3_9ACTN
MVVSYVVGNDTNDDVTDGRQILSDWKLRDLQQAHGIWVTLDLDEDSEGHLRQDSAADVGADRQGCNALMP